MRHVGLAYSTVLAALVLGSAFELIAQVTTATIYGVVSDTSGAVLPGANVTVTNQGTNLARQIVSDERGEFALPALPAGRYTVKIELANFKTLTNQGLELGAGQTVRQTFALELGQVTENITVADTAALVETASAAQKESLASQQVTELPLSRRNLISLVTLAPGVADASVGLAGNGNIRLNGVAEGGSTITVDGTNAVANPETRGMGQYGGQSQISIMSVDAVAEVQVIKGILPAEYGGVVGGQINFLSRSGTNQIHGSAVENYQNEAFFARDTFLPSTSAKPEDRFNQFGASVGGPIVRNRAFFFGTYEGYRENAGVIVTGTVPTQALKDQIQAALPFPETKIALAPLPTPNQAINANVGQYTAAKAQTRHENHLMAKVDVVILGGNLSVTYSRMRPTTVNPSIYVGDSNNQSFLNQQDRIAAQYVLSRGSWVSETRFGWNKTGLNREQSFWFQTNPANSAQPELTTVGNRIGLFSVSGLFTTPSSEVLALSGRAFSAEQKLSRVIGKHNLKAGVDWSRQGGSKDNPQNTNYVYQTLPDLLANIPSTVTLISGQPPHDGHLDEFGGFIQDDWRISKRLILNLGVRQDFYPTAHFHATTNRAALIYNLAPPTSIAKMDFGAQVDPNNPYNADWINIAPRVGFAWTVDSKGKTVLRGGSGVLFSPQLLALFQNQLSDPFIPGTVSWNKTDSAARGLKWPMYATDLQAVQLRDSAGKPTVYSLIDTNLRNPFTVQTMVDVERSLGGDWMLEAGYFRTDGRNFPMQRPLAQAFDRQTGLRPNPALGTPSGYYITSEQTMVYNALQTSMRKRFSRRLGLDFHYTLSKGWADQGGALSSSFVNADVFVTQDFFNPFIDREPLSQEARHRFASNVIYMLPGFTRSKGFLKYALSGWQVSGILTARSGVALRITQPSGIANSRPDFVGGDPMLSNYRTTRVFLNKAAFASVPTYAATGATIRAGTENPSQVHGPGQWTINASLGKTFSFSDRIRLEIRGDWLNAFNHVNYNNPTAAINSPIFGAVTGDAGPRTGQLNARFIF
jgi:hypothetical protein